jgi:hypothetical protein
MKKKMCIGRLTVFLLTIMVVFASCGSPESLVKKGRIKLDESITVGDAFDNYQYFMKTKWSSFKDSQGRKIVQVEGELDLSDITDAESGMTFNLFQEGVFEEFMLPFFLNTAFISQSYKSEVIDGDLQALKGLLETRRELRNDNIAQAINGYENDPEGNRNYASDILTKYRNDQKQARLAEMSMSYINEVYGPVEDWSDGLILETIRLDYRSESKKEKLLAIAPEEVSTYARIENVYGYSIYGIKEEHVPTLEYLIDGKVDEAFKEYNQVAGSLGTNLKKNKGQYACQFAIEDDSFRFYAGSLVMTVYVDGLDAPITFEIMEPEEVLPFLIAVYSNNVIIEYLQ